MLFMFYHNTPRLVNNLLNVVYHKKHLYDFIFVVQITKYK